MSLTLILGDVPVSAVIAYRRGIITVLVAHVALSAGVNAVVNGSSPAFSPREEGTCSPGGSES